MAVTARIVALFSAISYLLFVSAASRVAVLPSALHEDDGQPSLPSEEKTTTTVSLPSSIPVDGFQQVDLTLHRPVDIHHLHHVHLHGMEHTDTDDVRGHHHHHHHHNHEGFVIPYGDDMIMPGKEERLQKEVEEVEAAERGAVEELKKWNPASADWEQAPEERRHRKVKCEHMKKRSKEEDSDSDDDDETEMMMKKLKRMRKERKERKKREGGGWMEWFSGFWNGF